MKPNYDLIAKKAILDLAQDIITPHVMRLHPGILDPLVAAVMRFQEKETLENQTALAKALVTATAITLTVAMKGATLMVRDRVQAMQAVTTVRDMERLMEKAVAEDIPAQEDDGKI